MRFLTDECEIRVINGEIIVDYRNERNVTITTNEGTQRRPVSSVFPGISRNWWTANWNGANWNLDLDCGCQRFNGHTTTLHVKRALKTAGLTVDDIKVVVKEAKRHEHFSVSRCY